MEQRHFDRELLELKAQALALKEEYLAWLQSSLAPSAPEGGAR